MPEKEKIKKHYHGHWERLRQRFMKSGFEGFHDYEILELLLTYASKPATDTKPIAKALLERFKTIPNVLDARPEELEGIPGVGPKAAQFFQILRTTISRYFKDKVFEQKAFLSLNELVDYLRAVIGGKKNEVVHVLYLNSKNELLHAEDLGEGTVSETVAFPRKIVEGTLKYGATSVIIAHNHPGGLPEPSGNDNLITDAVKKALSTVSVSLQEHVIISDDDYFSYRKSGYFD